MNVPRLLSAIALCFVLVYAASTADARRSRRPAPSADAKPQVDPQRQAYLDTLNQRIADARATLADAPDQSAAQFELAKALYFLAVEGDDPAAIESHGLFAALHQQDPDDPVILAYHGSTVMLQARRYLLPWKKMDRANSGLALMDRAIAAAPEQPEVRFVRAMSTANLPGFFERQPQTLADFAWLMDRADAIEEAAALEPPHLAAALYRYGVLCAEADRPDDARAAWRRAIDAAPDSGVAADARRALEGG